MLRAATEIPKLVEACGVNVPCMSMLTYGFGVALAAFAGVLAAPILQVSPLMGSNLIIVVFAVVVIGGMGSILGSIITGLGLGVVEGFTKVFWPEARSEEHTSELQSLMRISYAVFCLKKKTKTRQQQHTTHS